MSTSTGNTPSQAEPRAEAAEGSSRRPAAAIASPGASSPPVPSTQDRAHRPGTDKFLRDRLEQYKSESTPPHGSALAFRAFKFPSQSQAAKALDDFLDKSPPSTAPSDATSKHVWICAADRQGSGPRDVEEDRMKLALARAGKEMADLKSAFDRIDSDDRIPLRASIARGRSKAQRKSALARRLEEDVLPGLAMEGGLLTGKWLWFKAPRHVDYLTRVLARSIVHGPLSKLKRARVHTLKVSCSDQTKDGEHLVALYYDDIWDRGASREIVECVIEQHGQSRSAAKADLWSVLGLHSKHWSTIAPSIYTYDSLLPRDVQDDLMDAYDQRNPAGPSRDRNEPGTSAERHRQPSGEYERRSAASGSRSPAVNTNGQSVHSPRGAKRPASPDRPPSPPSKSQALPISSRSVSPLQQRAQHEGAGDISQTNANHTSGAAAVQTPGSGDESHTESEEGEVWSAPRAVPGPGSASSTSEEVFFSPVASVEPDSPPLPLPPLTDQQPANDQRQTPLSPTANRGQGRTEPLRPRKIDFEDWKWAKLARVALSSRDVGGWQILDCPQVAQELLPPDVYFARAVIRRDEERQKSGTSSVTNVTTDVPSASNDAHQEIRTDAGPSSANATFTPDQRADDGLWPVPRLPCSPINRPLPEVYNEIWDGLQLEEKHYGRIVQRQLNPYFADYSSEAETEMEGASQITGDPVDLLRERRARQRRQSRDESFPAAEAPRRPRGRPRKVRPEGAEDPSTSDASRAPPGPPRKRGRPRKIRPEQLEEPPSHDQTRSSSLLSASPGFLAMGEDGSDEEWSAPGTGAVTSSSNVSATDSRRSSLGSLGGDSAPSISRPEQVADDVVNQPRVSESQRVQPVVPGSSTTFRSRQGNPPAQEPILRASGVAATAKTSSAQDVSDPHHLGERARGKQRARSREPSSNAQPSPVTSLRPENTASAKALGKRPAKDKEVSSGDDDVEPLQWDLSAMNGGWAVGTSKRPAPGPRPSSPKKQRSDRSKMRARARIITPTEEEEVDEVWEEEKRQERKRLAHRERRLRDREQKRKERQQQGKAAKTTARRVQDSNSSPASSDSLDAAPINWDLSNLHGQKLTTASSSSSVEASDDDQSKPPSVLPSKKALGKSSAVSTSQPSRSLPVRRSPPARRASPSPSPPATAPLWQPTPLFLRDASPGAESPSSSSGYQVLQVAVKSSPDSSQANGGTNGANGTSAAGGRGGGGGAKGDGRSMADAILLSDDDD